MAREIFSSKALMKTYSPEEHKQAFDVWTTTRNLTEAARVIECDWGTVKRWMQMDYLCAFNCPWHGWIELLYEKENALNTKLYLVNAGIGDPVAHDKAIRDAVLNPDTNAPRVEAVDSIVRSDLERVAHWEFIYSKVMYDMTGLVTDWKHFKGSSAEGKTADEIEEEVRNVLRGGLHCTSMKDGVRMLKTIRSEIEAIVGNARAATGPISQEDERTSREDLRKLKRLAETLPAEELRSLMDDNGREAAAG